jgi:hypothetical protein
MLPSIIHQNFIESDQLDHISQSIFADNNKYDDLDEIDAAGNQRLSSFYYTWKFYSLQFRHIRDLLLPKFQEISKLNLVIDHSHILDSIMPYSVHSDWFQERMLLKKLEPAYTIIIPLDTYPTSTLAFHQSGKIKIFSDYVEQEQPPKVVGELKISTELRNKYLSHISNDTLDYLSIKEIFGWKKGSVYFCDRRHYHCSDNYLTQGITGKRALIFWTSLPRVEPGSTTDLP